MRHLTLTKFIGYLSAAAIIAVAAAVAGCTTDEDPGHWNAPPDGKGILEFGFTSENNPGLSEACVCEIDGTLITGRIARLEDDPRALAASFRTSGGRVWVGNVEQVSGVTVNDFSKPVKYRVESDGEETREYTVRLSHFTGLPVVYIDTRSGTAVKSRYEWEEAEFRLDGGLDFGDLAPQQIEIKGRGNSTWTNMRRKPPYNIRFASRRKVLGMPEHRRWSLIANYRDKTLLRNAVSYFIGYQTSGLEWTPKYRDVELVFNGKFAGVYQLTEQIRVDPDRVDIDELLPTDTDPERITGGYIIEVDRCTIVNDENYFFYAQYMHRKWDMNGDRTQIVQKYPLREDSNPVQAAWLNDYVLGIEQALRDAYGMDGEQREQELNAVIDKYFHLPSIIDQWLVYEISGTEEPFNNNSFFMYKKRGDTRLYGGPVWDFDYHSYMPLYASEWRNRTALWFLWMFESEAFRVSVKERWGLLYPGLEAEILGFIDLQEKYLALSMQANWELHEAALKKESFANQNGDEKIPYGEAVARMRSYIPVRLRWLNENINNL